MGPHTWKAIDPIKCTFVYNDTEDADYEEWVTKPVQTTTPASEDAEANEKPKTELVYEKNVNRRRHELLFKFLNSCQEYVTYNFVGQVMDATIKGVTRDLPPGKIFCSSDYSEVMKNEASEQLQSQYYALKTSRILVIVAMRHAVMEIDGEESTVEHPKYVYENFFFCADGDQCSSQSWVGGYTQYGIRTMMEYYIDLYHGVQLQREKKSMPGVPCTSVEIDAFNISSDNCAEQYKCKHVFVNVSRLMEIISKPRPWLKYKKFVIVWFWAGAGCFKWRHDGAGGWFKNVIRQELLRNNTKKSKLKGMINGVKEIVEFGNNELAVPEHKPLK
jgi:hypothetical protein